MIAGRIRKYCERRYETNDPPTGDATILNKIETLPSIFETRVQQQQQSESLETSVTDYVDNESNSSSPLDQLESIPSMSTPKIHKGDQTTASEIKKEILLDNGFNVEENYYAKNEETDGKVQLPIQRLTGEDSLMEESESLGDISEVEVI